MKQSTRRYAKRQVSWIRNKLLPAVNAVNTTNSESIVPTYLLDATGTFRRYLTCRPCLKVYRIKRQLGLKRASNWKRHH